MSRTENLGHLEETQKNATFLLHKEGHTVKNYHLIERVGEGSYGEVWKAERGGVLVALKILKTTLNSDDTRRVLKSLETLKDLRHPFLLNADNYWVDGDRFYIEMELADGGSLKELLITNKNSTQRAIPKEDLLWYFTGTAEALDFLHGHQPVTLHRDIKPGNILLVQGNAKLADFDLLRQVSGDHTSTETKGGTPIYMAPESIEKNFFSPQSDLFSFAVTYVELRQGRLPFTGPTAFQICQRILQDPPELSDLFDPEEKKVVLKALAKNPRNRFATCGEFVAELKRVVPWEATPPAPPPGLWREVKVDKAGRSWAKTLLKIMVPMLLIAAAAGYWFFLSTGAKAEVGEFIEQRQYAEALQAIERNRWLLPFRTDLDKDIAERWWTDLKEPPGDASLEVLKASLSELRKFKDAFPDHEGAKTRQDRLAAGMSGLLLVQVEQFLRANKIDAARDLVAKNQELMGSAGKSLQAKIDDTQKVRATLNDAEQKLLKKDFERCLASLQADKALFAYDVDVASRKKLEEQARSGKTARDEAHQKYVAAIEETIKAKSLPKLRGQLAELVKFRTSYPKTDWLPALGGLQTQIQNDLLAEAWASLLAEKVVLTNTRRVLQEIKDLADQQTSDRLVEKNVAVLGALVKAHEADKKSWNEAMQVLIAQVRVNKTPDDPLTRNLWSALVPLERHTGLFRFEDLVELENTQPAILAPHIKPAHTKLLADVLERLVSKENWYPSNDKQSLRCATWCERLDQPRPWILALKVECLVASNKTAEAGDQIGPWPETGWYGAYVHAWALEKNPAAPNRRKRLDDAVDRLTAVLKNDPKMVSPPERTMHAAGILQSAVGTLQRGGKDRREFATNQDAEKAIIWLSLIFDLVEPANSEKGLDNLVDLVFAAAKTAKLEMAGKRIENGNFSAVAKVSGHYWLAKAYVADKNSANPALAHFEKALQLKAPGVDAVRKKAATEAAEYALRLAKYNYDDPTNNWGLAIGYSKGCQLFALALRDMDLEAAARLNGEAVKVLADSVYREKGGKKDLDRNLLERYRVFEDYLRNKPLEGFHLPVVVLRIKSAGTKKSDLETNIADGEKAILAAKTLATKQADKEKKEFWEKLTAECLVYLGQARLSLVKRQMEKDERAILRSYESILRSYDEAQKMKRYADQWPGELSFHIGSLQYDASIRLKKLDGKLAALPKAEAAHRELTKCLQSITESMKGPLEPDVRKKLETVRPYIEKVLPDLEKDYDLVPKKSFTRDSDGVPGEVLVGNLRIEVSNIHAVLTQRGQAATAKKSSHGSNTDQTRTRKSQE